MQLTPEQINEFMSKAILESQIGEAVQAAVKRQIETLSKSWDNPFDAVIKQHIQKIIDEHLVNEYRGFLEEKIKARMAEFMTDEVVTKIMEAGIEKLRRNY